MEQTDLSGLSPNSHSPEQFIQVFVSHSDEDRGLVEVSLIEPLRLEGFSPWFAPREIDPGSSIADSIQGGLVDSHWFLLALTERSASSPWVKGEVAEAFRMLPTGRIITVCFDETPAATCDTRLAALKTLDFRGEREESFKELILSIRNSRGSGNDSRPAGTSGTKNRPFSGQSTSHFLKVFKDLRDGQSPRCDSAKRMLASVSWAQLSSVIIEVSRSSDRSNVNLVLDVLSAIDSHKNIVELLDRICHLLEGEQKDRAISIRRQKHASLDVARLNEIFEDRAPSYRVERALGTGMITSSYLVREHVSGKSRVLRTLLRPYAEDLDLRFKYMELLKNAVDSIHPRLVIIRQIDVIPEHSLYFCIRDYVDGATLQDAFDSGHRFEPTQILCIVEQIASALESVHALGHVHNGVKPSNIFLTSSHGAVLGDAALPLSGLPTTHRHVIYGYRYTAPEALRYGVSFGPKADIYALGCVFYQLLSGRPPFIADDPIELIQFHRNERAPAPKYAHDPLSQAAEKILFEMLDKDPFKRPSSPCTLLRDIGTSIGNVEPLSSQRVPLLTTTSRNRIEAPRSIVALDWNALLANKPPTGDASGPQTNNLEFPPAVVSDVALQRSIDVPYMKAPSQSHIIPPSIGVSSTSEFLNPTYRELELRSVGPYTILEILGEGGMGIVYLALQEVPIHRRVALKIIKPGMDTRQVISRFEVEQEALALMDHPNVARVFDAGVSEQGRPYFVMEYVPGISITAYCDKHRLNLAERLQLFMDVCHAIQHAHQKGIIHRDVKPTNVLVAVKNEKPMVKVIDFGVAKAVYHRLTERTLFTEQGQIIGTPNYMSPEQAEMSALDVDVRTDIYSLGVILYELLAGTLPFDQRLLQDGYAEIQRIIREVEPSRPSRALTLGEHTAEIAHRRSMRLNGLVRELRDGLDWIVMKCLEKDRSRRYSTALELAMDIQRYLRQEAILAGPQSAAYRARKLVRRHRSGISMAILTILSTLVAYFVGKCQ